MSGNMSIWDSIKRPPKSALKKINAGRLKGMTDISPQWRYEALTEQFGPCGIGWRFEICQLWVEDGEPPMKIANAKINLFIRSGDTWSEPIPGIGGSMLVAKERNGPYTSDEAFKMAVTDAIGAAGKMLGLAADIYAGKFDGSKYKDESPQANKSQSVPVTPKRMVYNVLTANKLSDAEITGLMNFIKATEGVESLSEATLRDIAKRPQAFINEWKEAVGAA